MAGCCGELEEEEEAKDWDTPHCGTQATQGTPGTHATPLIVALPAASLPLSCTMLLSLRHSKTPRTSGATGAQPPTVAAGALSH